MREYTVERISREKLEGVVMRKGTVPAGGDVVDVDEPVAASA